MSYSSSSAMTSSTMSSESAPRSSMNDASGVTSPSLTPSCSQMISRTLASTADAIPTLLILNVEAAVDPDDLTGDVARFTASQEPNQIRHLAHRPEPTSGDDAQILRSPGLGQVGGHLGLDEAGGDGVDGDLARGQLARHGFGETDDAR